MSNSKKVSAPAKLHGDSSKDKNDADVNERRRSWFREVFNPNPTTSQSRTDNCKSGIKSANDENMNDYRSTGTSKMKVQATKSTPPTAFVEHGTDVINSTTGSQRFSADNNSLGVKLPRPNSLPIFPSFGMLTKGYRQSWSNDHRGRGIDEEFDASEIILFLSQGSK